MSTSRDTVSDRIQTRSHEYLDNAIFGEDGHLEGRHGQC